MSEALTQLGLAAFGLTATWLALGRGDRGRRWAPVLGLFGQIFWSLFALQAHRAGLDVRGLWAVVGAYSLVYIRGLVIQWLPVWKTRQNRWTVTR